MNDLLFPGDSLFREIQFTFHVHLPENVEKIGRPVVLVNRDELGLWKSPIVKLRQPYPQNPTYWQSDPVTISFSRSHFFNVNVIHPFIQYKYAIHIPKSMFAKGDERIIFEGFGESFNIIQDNRTLNIERNDQFDIWKSNHEFKLSVIRDFAFVDYIYNSIKTDNLKDKVMEYQHLLALHNDYTIRASNLNFISNHIDDRPKERRLFLCLLLGYYISREKSTFHVLPNKFPSKLLLNAFEDYNQKTLLSDTKDQIYNAIMTLVQHNAFHMQFDWPIIFTISTEVDPNYTFIDHLKDLKYFDEDLTKFVEIIRPFIESIESHAYIRIAKVMFECIISDF